MILKQLLDIAQKGSEEPAAYWSEGTKDARARLVTDVRSLEQTLEADTPARATLAELVALLSTPDEYEFALARNLMAVAEMFRDEATGEHVGLIGQFTTASMKFFQAAQSRHAFAGKRRELKARLSAEQQAAHDLRLFRGAGMIWCLEFYLSLYKAIVDASNETEKRRLVLDETLDLGFGAVPGLLADFSQDEALAKFIELILDDQRRDRLIRAYYSAKMVIRQARVRTTPEVIDAFRTFVIALMRLYQEMGIERLGSAFLTPYGKNPRIADIHI